MKSWKKSIVIHAAANEVFAYIDDPMALPVWIPSLIQVRNVIGSGEGQQEEWTYKVAGLLLRGQAIVVEYVPNKRAVHQTIGMAHGNVGYTVEPHADGASLTLEIDYEIPIPVLGKLAEHIVIQRNSREFEAALVNVKETLQG